MPEDEQPGSPRKLTLSLSVREIPTHSMAEALVSISFNTVGNQRQCSLLLWPLGIGGAGGCLDIYP